MFESTDLTTPRAEWVATVEVVFADALLFDGLRLFDAVVLVWPATAAGAANPVIGTASIAPSTIAAVRIFRMSFSLLLVSCVCRSSGTPLHFAPLTLTARERRINFF